jgi:pyruvate dehydrogenase E2 component (dihydrolipoamide acetyltransferase)
MSSPSAGVDHAAFGDIEKVPLSRLQRLAAAHLTRSWSAIPHVTHHDELDVTDLEALRRSQPPDDARPTVLAFLIKAVSSLLRDEPRFNSSLDAGGADLILKKYVHIGVAVDVTGGLLVPVLRNCDTQSVGAIAADVVRLSSKARDKGLPLADMSGGCFTISSLGRDGGMGFTPIINPPEVAILGLSALQERPCRGRNHSVDWRVMLPVSLSYDHRVINGADAARFITKLKARVAAPRALLG